MIDRANEFIARIALNISDKPVAEQRQVIKNYDNNTQLAIYKALETMNKPRKKAPLTLTNIVLRTVGRPRSEWTPSCRL